MKTILKIKVANHVLLNIWNNINRIVYMYMNIVFLNNNSLSLSLAISGNIILFVASELAQTFCVNSSANKKNQ